MANESEKQKRRAMAIRAGLIPIEGDPEDDE
jgi:hypothetical protein